MTAPGKLDRPRPRLTIGGESELIVDGLGKRMEHAHHPDLNPGAGKRAGCEPVSAAAAVGDAPNTAAAIAVTVAGVEPDHLIALSVAPVRLRHEGGGTPGSGAAAVRARVGRRIAHRPDNHPLVSRPDVPWHERPGRRRQPELDKGRIAATTPAIDERAA